MKTPPSLVAEDVQREQTSGPKDEEMPHKCHMPSEELFEAAPVSPLPSSRDDQKAAAASGPACPEAVAWSKRQPGTLRYIVAKGTLDPTGLTGTLWAALARALCKSVIEGEENALAVATPCVFFSEMECLRWVLTAAGSAMEATVPWLMTMLTGRMRSAFMQSGVSAKARYTLLELIELRASGWQPNAAQVQYYRLQAKPGPPGTRS
ncbi:uncharacterized protein [Dermacentor andersoni]|uniref:uncharacterized protein n=1 Tax=Dermacentor andersoni TaxID=34620 RepID=UPI003B3AE5D7